jgi:hypothetical protein
MVFAIAGPIPGSDSNCSIVAEFKLIFSVAAGVEADFVAAGVEADFWAIIETELIIRPTHRARIHTTLIFREFIKTSYWRKVSDIKKLIFPDFTYLMIPRPFEPKKMWVSVFWFPVSG